MLSAIHSALSGLAAFEKEIEVTAHNVANVNTNGFKKSRTEFVSMATGGVLPVVQKGDSAGPTVLNNTGYSPAHVELSNVDFGEETVNQVLAQRGFEANLRALQAADDMLGTILDMKR